MAHTRIQTLIQEEKSLCVCVCVSGELLVHGLYYLRYIRYVYMVGFKQKDEVGYWGLVEDIQCSINKPWLLKSKKVTNQLSVVFPIC